MRDAIGANLFGFGVGGLLLIVQLTLIGAFQFFAGDLHWGDVEMAEVAFIQAVGFLVIGLALLLFVLAVFYWVSTAVIVFPFSILSNALNFPSWLAGLIGGSVAGWLVHAGLGSPGVGDSIPLAMEISFLSSSIATGAVTGFMLPRLSGTKVD